MLISGEILICTVIFVLFGIYKWNSSRKRRFLPPGPLGLPVVGYLPFLDSHPATFGKLAKKYGNIFSIQLGTFDVVVLNDIELVRKAFRQNVFSGRPKAIIAMSISSDGMSFNEGIAWDQQRRFTLKALRQLGFGKSSLEFHIQTEVKRLIQHLRVNGKTPICLKRILEISVLNTLWSIVASKEYALDDPDALHMHKICYDGFIEPKVAGPVWFMPWLAKLAPDWTGFSAIKIAVDKMEGVFKTLIRERQKTFSPENLQDFIDFYLLEISRTDDPTSSFYKDTGVHSLSHVLIDLFTAGSDTTSSTLSFAILYLLHHPNVLLKMRDEIDSIVIGNHMPTLADRPRLPYSEATLSEVMRMSSIVSGALLHSTMANTEFEGYKFPKGTIVISNLWEIHHDSKHWEHPYDFKPQRFLDSNGNYEKPDFLIPFGVGKRICPAESLAMTNSFLFLTNLVKSFDFSLEPGCPLPSLEPKQGLVLATQDYNVILTPRF